MENSSRKRRIFIGSSSESIPIVEEIIRILSEDYECVTWYENFFLNGDYVFTNLTQKIITFDYAIMIGGKDDKVIRLQNNMERYSPRDNVYIEFGLCSGMLSPKRVMLLKHTECVEASDLKGMILREYSTPEEAVALTLSWINERVCHEGELLSRDEIDLLPTVGVAIGYYYNFIRKLVNIMGETDTVELEGNSYSIDQSKIIVLIPTFVSDKVDNYSTHLIRKKKLKKALVNGFRVLIDPQDLQNNQLTIYDIPSTLLSVFQTVNYIFNNPAQNTNDTLCAKYRALDNFYDVVRREIEDEFDVREIVEIHRYSNE